MNKKFLHIFISVLLSSSIVIAFIIFLPPLFNFSESNTSLQGIAEAGSGKDVALGQKTDVADYKKLPIDFDGDGKKEEVFSLAYGAKDFDPDLIIGVRAAATNLRMQSWSVPFADFFESVSPFKDHLEIFEVVDLNTDGRQEVMVSVRYAGSGGYKVSYLLAEVDDHIRKMYFADVFDPKEEFVKESTGKETVSIQKKNIVLTGACCSGGQQKISFFSFDGKNLFLERTEFTSIEGSN